MTEWRAPWLLALFVWPLTNVEAGSPGEQIDVGALIGERGLLSRGTAAGALVGTTDGDQHTDFSYLSLVAEQPPALPYEVSLVVQRLSTDITSIEFKTNSGTLIVANGYAGLYVDKNNEWYEPGTIDLDDALALRVVQRAEEVELYIGGKSFRTWKVTAKRSESIGVAAKGLRGRRGSIVLQGLRVQRSSPN